MPHLAPGSPQQMPPLQPSPVQQGYVAPVVVLDPSHGGVDTGARGANGTTEKDIVLQFARAARTELLRQGYRTVLTRDDDSNPSYDDRSATANSYREPIFLSLHVSSTGTAGTARVYYYQFWKALPPAGVSPSSSSGDQPEVPLILSSGPPTTLTPWEEAQRPFTSASQRLGDQLQSQLAATFAGSPAVSTAAAIRGLRSLAAPAVAIEISSVAVTNSKSLTDMAAPLASSIVKAIQAFRPLNSAGAK
jgi:N-acetylmuramoyl-L-alanine amidase